MAWRGKQLKVVEKFTYLVLKKKIYPTSPDSENNFPQGIANKLVTRKGIQIGHIPVRDKKLWYVQDSLLYPSIRELLFRTVNHLALQFATRVRAGAHLHPLGTSQRTPHLVG
jgi:hypothetical protein